MDADLAHRRHGWRPVGDLGDEQKVSCANH